MRWRRFDGAQRGAGLLHDLELNRPAGLVLDNRRPVSHAASRRDVVDPKVNEIAAAQLAIDGEIEQRQIALAANATRQPYDASSQRLPTRRSNA